MYHANAWGLVYACPLAGTRLILPGAKLDGANLYELMEKEKPDQAWGVPSVWIILLQYCEQNNKKLDSLKTTLIGGSAVPRSMVETFHK
jgi:fatty-acyl-CoA synthase